MKQQITQSSALDHVAQVEMSQYINVIKNTSFVSRIFEHIRITYANIRILILVIGAILILNCIALFLLMQNLMEAN